MSVAVWLVQRAFGRRVTALLPVLLVVVAGASTTFLVVEAAQRTSTAFPRYLDRADVGDIEVNPSLFSDQIDEVIRELPGARRVTSSHLLYAGIDNDGTPMRYSEIPAETDHEGVFGSTDGRYRDMDRLAFRDGGPATGPSEGVVSTELADDRGLAVGDVIPVSFWPVIYDLQALYFGEDPMMHPLGVDPVTITGIATFQGEVLPDTLYPRGRMIVSPDLAAKYSCLPPQPPRDATFGEAIEVTTPPTCATSYVYWSVEIDGGVPGVEAAQEAFIHESEARNVDLPISMLEKDVRYLLITSTTAAEAQRVARSVQPTVTAFVVLGIAIAILTVVVTGLAVARGLRSPSADHRQLWQLGLTRGERTRVMAYPLLGTVVVGVAIAAAVAWWWSPIGPVGTVRVVEPSPARALGSDALLVLVGFLVVLAGLVVVLSRREAHRAERSPTLQRPALVPQLVQAVPPPVAMGLRAAWAGGRGTGLVVIGGALATGAIVAASVFGASLSTLLSTPTWHGWPWDAAIVSGAGYGGVDFTAAAEGLGERDDVEGWSGLGFWQSVTVDGVATPSLVVYDEPFELELATIEGRMPISADEVALGTQFADERGIDVGDEIVMRGNGLAIDRATVTGHVVLPALGPLQSDRAAPGYGLLLTQGALQPELVGGLFSFIGLDLRDGVDRDGVLVDLQDDVASWSRYGSPVLVSDPVVPAEIVDAGSMRVAPLAVATPIAGVGVLGFTAALVASGRARRRELATLRALGFTPRQVSRAIRVQAIAIVTASLVVGVPAGVIVGRALWRAFARGLGVVSTPTMSVAMLAIVVVGALAIAACVAVVPARLARHRELGSALRG